MQKQHVRSYRITDTGDLEVIHWQRGERTELSAHYEAIPRDRHHLRVEACLDVFRYADDQLSWVAVPNGHDVDAAATLAFLLQAFAEDARGGAGVPRDL
jgi:hypothetical protein